MIADILRDYWPLLIAAAILGLAWLYRRGDRDRLLTHPDLAGASVIRVSPVKQRVKELNLEYGRTRSGGSFFYVVIDEHGYPTRHLWMVEGRDVRRVE
ncbi:hypothetical protein [Phenylobacterium sp.]|jgi:hypothetical protein|uniref:hypothetical protein n=1 Tax=Phenylobacterium sp. TaxID=1871053 RepID=UPI002E36426C|nr:hypothetical protein [Phenylobacterium sp.]HEX4712494.1 hypothetical protein [Phenylobacterium sp.]